MSHTVVAIGIQWVDSFSIRWDSHTGRITPHVTMKPAVDDFIWEHPIMDGVGFGYRPLLDTENALRLAAVEFDFEEAAAAMLFKLTFGGNK